MPIIHYSSPFAIIFFIAKFATIILPSNANGLNILVIEPNFPRGMSHFALHKQMVEELAEKEWVKKVFFLIPLLSEQERDLDLEKRAEQSRGKLRIKNALVKRNNGEKGDKSAMYRPWEDINSQYGPGEITAVITRPEVFLELAEQKDLINELKREQFDVGLADVFYYGAFPLLWLANVKQIAAISNMHSPPVFFDFMNTAYLEKIIAERNVPEEFTATFKPDVMNSKMAFNDLDKKFKQIYRDHYSTKEEPPKFEDLFRKVKHYFINSQPFLDFELPSEILHDNKLKYIGGMVTMSKKIENEMQKLDDKEQDTIIQAKKGKGLIIVSFGTVVESEKTPVEKFNILFEAFKQFPDYVFLWRFHNNEYGQSAIDKHNEARGTRGMHIYTKTWLSQTALLADPTTRLFISHCGINSVNEAALYAVPLLCIPFFGDQFYNAAAVEKRELGAVVNIFDTNLKSDDVRKKISVALNKREEMKMAKIKMANAKPLETFLSTMEKFYEEKKKRIYQLNEIAVYGDLKLESTLTFEEYEHNEKFKEIFKKTVDKLENKLHEFVVKNSKINAELLLLNKREATTTNYDHLLKSEWGRELILRAKIFIAQVFSDGGEVTRLDLYSFMHANKEMGGPWLSSKGENLSLLLATIYGISELQSQEVDALINEEMWKEHLKNVPKLKMTVVPNNKKPLNHEKKREKFNTDQACDDHDREHCEEEEDQQQEEEPRNRVLIEGGGPVGLLSAIRLFMAGMHVTLVNDRKEYTRPQVIGLDMSWLAQLRFLLGTKFGELINNRPNSIGRVVTPHKGVLPIQYIEKVTKSRLEELIKFINGKKKGAKIELIYGSQVEAVRIEENAKGKNGVEEEKTIAMIKGTGGTQQIEFDLIVCAGGANDKLRDQIFGMSPRMRSKPISHGILRYDKYTPEIHIPKLLVLFGKDAEKIAGFMKKMDFQNASDGIVLTKGLKKMFKNFNKKMLNSNSNNVAIVVLETSNTLSILFRTPSPMVELYAAIEKEKKHLKFNKNKTDELERFWKRMLRKWAKVAFDFVNENYANRSFSFELDKYGNGDGNAKKEGAVSIDPTSGLFNVVVQTFDVPIKRIGKNSMAVVLGDALAAQHPLTGSGMSSGRMAVDRFLNNLHDLNGPYSEEKIEHFIEKVKKDLNGVKKHVTQFAKLVVDIIDDEEAKIDENITLGADAEEEKPTAGRI